MSSVPMHSYILLLAFLKLVIASQVELQELHTIFGNGEIVEYHGDDSSATLSCPNGKVIVWGYTYHFASGGYADVYCARQANTHCTVGATSCSISGCATNGNDENGIILYCSDSTIPSSSAKSLATDITYSNGGNELECPSGSKILMGFRFQFGYFSENTCYENNTGSCQIGAQKCSTTACSQSDAIQVLNILCAPTKYVDLIQAGSLTSLEKFKTSSGAVDTLSCTSETPVLLAAISFAIEHDFDSTFVATLREENTMYSYTNNAGIAQSSIGNFGSGGNRMGYLINLCAARLTDSPTESPTAMPTDNPTAMPTDNPTAMPTDNPTAMPTDNPTAMPTDNPTAMPTDNPTAMPTDNPTAMPTDNPTATPTGVPTDTPTVISTDTPTKSPTDTPTDTPTIISTDTPTKSPTRTDDEEPTDGKPTSSPTFSPTEYSFSPDDISLESSGSNPTASVDTPLYIVMGVGGFTFLALVTATMIYRRRKNTVSRTSALTSKRFKFDTDDRPYGNYRSSAVPLPKSGVSSLKRPSTLTEPVVQHDRTESITSYIDV